jgi:hypothetical protein
MTEQELDALLERARGGVSEEDFQKLEALLGSFLYLTRLLAEEDITLRKLREIFLYKKSEKTSKVLERAGLVARPPDQPGSTPPPDDARPNGAAAPAGGVSQDADPEPKRKAKGHGRNGAATYWGAQRIQVPHPTLKSGDPCPKCRKGKVYERQDGPQLLVRIVGQPPLGGKVYERDCLRCNLCGDAFSAPLPEGVGEEKYDASSGAMIGLLKYGNGLPFNRLDHLQENLGIPLPAQTQWEIVRDAAEKLTPVHVELIREAAQGKLFYNDDTSVRILALMAENAERVRRLALAAETEEERGSEKPRTGVFTTAILAVVGEWKIALFFSGRRHAGENLKEVLAQRASELGPPIEMCDALSRNLPKELEVIMANCLAHGRRQFVPIVENFPEECLHVLEEFREVYRNDAIAKERGLDAQARLAFHQEHSRPVMQRFQAWLTAKLEGREVEPNSGLGKAIAYLLRHWEKLTLFLRVPGAPLDNNLCEQALKVAIRHRKNALFYKTENGARVGDLFMSLIHTCELARVSAFDYLTELLRHPEELARSPQDWLPWNYRATIEGIRAP